MWNQQEIKKNVQVAILLHAAGPEAQEIHSHFSFAPGEAKANYETIWINLGLSIKQVKMLYSNNIGSGAGTRPRMRQ